MPRTLRTSPGAGTREPSRSAQLILALALACVLGLAAWQGRGVAVDSGVFVVLLFGVPLACTVGALVVTRVCASGAGALLVAALGVVSLVWSVVTALGAGPGLLLPSLLLLVAALGIRGQGRPAAGDR